MFKRLWYVLSKNSRSTNAMLFASTIFPSGLIAKEYFFTDLDNRDRVTIGLYGAQRNGADFHPAALSQADNIKGIKDKLTTIAHTKDKEPPEVVVSAYLIPDWDKGSHHKDEAYFIAQENFMEELKEKLGPDIRVENFGVKKSLSSEERGYLSHLVARGSNADMIKTHSIICPENLTRKHLQLDSNTIIHDYMNLYSSTFAQEKGSGSDALALDPVALNASYYDDHYVSAHNKIVFTVPNSKFAAVLREVHLDYCDKHKDDHLDSSTEVEKRSKNSPYSKVFVVALQRIGLTTSKAKPNGKVIYPAKMDEVGAYRLTKDVVTAVNMSWREDFRNGASEQIAKLKQLAMVKVGDADCDYACFVAAVKKFTGNLVEHGSDLYDDTVAHEQLLELSNTAVEKEIITKFYNNVKEKSPKCLCDLVQTFPNNSRANSLTNELFGCNVTALQEHARELQSKMLDSEPSTPTFRI